MQFVSKPLKIMLHGTFAHYSLISLASTDYFQAILEVNAMHISHRRISALIFFSAS